MIVSVVRCPCEYEGCADHHLIGIGKFYQGSGFTEHDARRIADCLNGCCNIPNPLALDDAFIALTDLILYITANNPKAFLGGGETVLDRARAAVGRLGE